MSFAGNEGLSEPALTEIENIIGFRLPSDYRAFLGRHNGGRNMDYPAIEIDGIPTICCDCLFGINRPRRASLMFWQAEMKGEIPEKSILIGNDPGGNFFLLDCTPEDVGVYYYDHTYSFPQSSDEKNSYWITADFGTFAKMIGVKQA